MNGDDIRAHSVAWMGRDACTWDLRSSILAIALQWYTWNQFLLCVAVVSNVALSKCRIYECDVV